MKRKQYRGNTRLVQMILLGMLCLVISGCVRGKVVDANKSGVKALELTLANMLTGACYKTATGDEGSFVFTGVPNGTYLLTAERYGYDPISRTFEYTGKNVKLDLVMENRSRVEFRTFEPPSLAPMMAMSPEIAVRQFAVYYPPSYDLEPTRYYPIIYWLHGNGQDPEEFFTDDWFRLNLQSVMDELIGRSLIEETILVVPDGELPESWMGPNARGSLYINSSYNGNFEDFVAVDLVGCVEENAGDCLGDGSDGLRVIRGGEARGMVGLCMGVTGALNCAIKYPGQYAAVAANWGFSSLNELIYPFKGDVTPLLRRYLEGEPWLVDWFNRKANAFFSSLDGEHYPYNLCPLQADGTLTMVEDPENPGELVELWSNYYLDNDPYTYLSEHPEAIEDLSFYIDVGEGDEFQLWENNMAFSALLEDLGLPASQSMDPSNRHFFEIFPSNSHVDIVSNHPRMIQAIQFVANHLNAW